MSEQLLADQIDKILRESKAPMTTHEVTKELRERKQLPDEWTVLDVYDVMRRWFT